jgi:hypothetical protein
MTTDPRILARMTGSFWAITFLAGVGALAVGGNTGLYLNAFAGLAYIGAAVYASGLLSPVDRNLAILTGILGSLGSLVGFNEDFLHFLPVARNTQFTFFGAQLLLLGYLIFRSQYIPAWVGILLSIGGLGWLTWGLSSILAPDFGRSLFPYILVPGVLGETTLILRLLLRGVDQDRWKERTSHPNN